MKERITEYLEDFYFPDLRNLLDDEDLTSETLYKYANYIDWARKSGDPIEIGPNDTALTKEQLCLNDMAANASKYDKIALSQDQWYLKSQEL